MARPKGINQKTRWRAHSIRLAGYADRVQSVYDTLNREVANAVVRSGYNGTEPFRFSDYPQTKKKIEEVQAAFVRDLRSVIYSGTSEEWKQSNLVQDLLADNVLKFYGAKKNGKKHRVYYQTNSAALKAFQQRKDDGLNLSQKLWNQSKGYKEEMEFAISSAIEKGTSAVKLSKRLSKYLQDFPSLKHDYKEKYGKAVICQDCEYRSIRLARSEINMAYRKAEQERWKQFDFVLGYEVKLTQNGHHVPDICDDLAGKYPKDFIFLGWHPNCMCYVIPILKSEEQFWGMEEVHEITEVPDSMKIWIKENEDRIAEAEEEGTLPYWFSDNKKRMKDIMSKDIHDLVDTSSLEYKRRRVLFEERSSLYARLLEDEEYKNVRFDRRTLGLMATHVEHNFDKIGGKYERSVQKAGYRTGHSVILEKEYGDVIGQRFTEGTWDGMEFEVSGRETATPNNVLRGLVHCAAKRKTEVAVLHFPNGGFDESVFEKVLKRYKGLERLEDGQFLKFKRIVCVEHGEIVYDKIFE